jgi:hypothetical protein
MVAWGVVACALVQSGCFVLALGTTRSEQLSSNIIGRRTTSQQASLDGSQCYVDHRLEVKTRSVIPRQWRAFAGGELLLGLLTAPFGTPVVYAAGPAIVDGLLALVYVLAQDQKVSMRRRWEVSNETSGCR